MQKSFLVAVAIVAMVTACTWLKPEQETVTGQSVAANATSSQRPNILLIVVDDLGFTDLGSFGGEIETPNLDQLANSGMRLTNFYTAPTCSPTRAMLLTGADNHLVGLGNMAELLSPNQKGQPGYEGYLNDRAANLAEVLQQAGYNTYMTGKWHLGKQAEHSPAARGFDKSYALLNGGGGHFDDLGLFEGGAQYREDGKLVKLPEDFYSTQFFTEKLMQYIDSGKQQNKPFFAYLAYSAVHWPLQAPAESIAKYRGKYEQGYDQLHEQRINNAIAQGVVPADSKPVPRLQGEPAWADLDEEKKHYEQRKMEIYAAMLDDVDIYMGKLLNYLKSTGQYDNTIIFFMSDNGAEGHDLEHGLVEAIPWVEKCCNNRYENMGKPDSYLLVGPNWARATAGPYKHYKAYTSEGGIKAPAFITYPQKTFAQPLSTQFVTVKDVMPTLLQLVGVEAPAGQFLGREVLPITGRSLLVNSVDTSALPEAGWELIGRRGYRHGDWKLLHQQAPYGNDAWQLYNLVTDPGEQKNLAAKHPQKLQAMIKRWQQYAKKNNVIIPDWYSSY
ncbi:arylsulfatase [Dasania marina]|uniref:arylsulfatase n=1 Tax=Dasania marina TaxID=471499 RepID=UPI00036ED718|nr:arylsulfatase [Dasania marina]